MKKSKTIEFRHERRKSEVLQSSELLSLQVPPFPSKSTTAIISGRLVLFDALFNSVPRPQETHPEPGYSVCCLMIIT